MTRAVTFIGIFQIASLLCGFLALGIILKICGYPAENPAAEWSPLAVFLRTRGLHFLFVPACWAVYASLAVRINRGLLSEPPAMVLGILISCAILLSFLFAMIHPFSSIHFTKAEGSVRAYVQTTLFPAARSLSLSPLQIRAFLHACTA